MHKRLIIVVGIGVGGLLALAAVGSWQLDLSDSPRTLRPEEKNNVTAPPLLQPLNPSPIAIVSPKMVGPRVGVPDGAPNAYGFWSFAVPVPGVLSRSGQPLLSEFSWLKEQGWKSVINLRVDGERDEVGDDAKLTGFRDLGLTYLHLPLTDGHPPTVEQAESYLSFVTDPVNQPAHLHCRGGIGRTGTLVALYRYAVQGWPMADAIVESRAFKGGVSASQEDWLLAWATNHAPGSYQL